MVTFRCSVLDPSGAAPSTDLDIRAPSGTTWQQVRDAVAAAVGLPPTLPLTCDGQPLADTSLLGHPPLLDGALLVAAATPTAARPRGLLELHVAGGPDSGRIHALRPGEHRIGRCASADIRVEDPDASRWHLALSVTPDGVTVRDLGSVNGTSVDGVAVMDEPHVVRAGQRIRLGHTTLLVRSPAVRPAATRATGAGTVEVNRAPRPAPAVVPLELHRPAPPVVTQRHRLPVLAMLLPLAVAVPVALIAHQPMFLLFALMSPVMILGGAVSDRGRGRREGRESARAFDQQSAAITTAVARALDDELTARRQANPDPADLLRCVTHPTARLWERGPGSADVLQVALGTGRVPAQVRLSSAQGAVEPQHLDDAPVTVSLLAVGHLGVAGPREQVLAVARHLVCQLCTWHSPRLVQLVIVSSDDTWAWARWLPHQRRARQVHDLDAAPDVIATLLDLATERSRQVSPAWAGPFVVVVVDSASTLRSLPGLAELMVAGPSSGIHAICLDADLSGLAGECGATVDLTVEGARLSTEEATVAPVRWDGVGPGWAERVARALGGLRDATPEPNGGALGVDVRLLDLLPLDPTDPAAVLCGWNRCPASTLAAIGMTSDGPAVVDLRRDGPHLLVAGTTGAGKSELLQTLVTALAVANRPDELSFVLVDYKGGAAFRGCVDLPHTAGLVTDLDEHLAERALVSLGAELTRRERQLDMLGCNDIDAYQAARATDPQLPPLARLVVVIDEFRLLAEELPQFVTGLVRVAAVGRSLGVHLVLATQRPAGIVSADIKANVNLRIALRVRDRADSDDVVDAPDAARIDAAVPGRALFRSGSGALRAVQIARVSGASSTTDPSQIAVRRVGDPAPASAAPVDDLARIVTALRGATATGRITSAPLAWLPPLATMLPLDDLPPDATGGVAIGRLDLPARQQQPVLRWHPVEDGHLGVCGGPRSGRTSALVAIALALARSHSPQDLNLCLIDAASGRLLVLQALPHTVTTLSKDHPQLVARLIGRLAAEVRRRLEGDGAGPPLVLLIDGWEALVETLDGLDHGHTSELLSALLRDGRAAGLRVVVAGHRALLTSRLTSLLTDRLLLKVTDPTDLMLAGLPSTCAEPTPSPGRGVRASDGATMQLGLAPSDIEVAMAALARTWPTPDRSAPTRRALRVRELPVSVTLDQLTAAASPGVGVLLGVGGDDALPVRLDLGRHPVVVVAGPPGSGRSGTLVTIARQLHAARLPVIAVCPHASPLAAGPWPVIGPRDGELLAEHLAAAPGTCVLADDLDHLDHRDQGGIDAALDDLARRRGPTQVVLAGTSSAVLGAFRGALATARATRTGVLLRPLTATDGEVLGVRAQLGDRTGPGRGLLVVEGEQRALQVAH